MGVGRIFFRGEVVDFSGGSQQIFFMGWGNHGEISFYPFETRRKTIFC